MASSRNWCVGPVMAVNAEGINLLSGLQVRSSGNFEI